MALLLVKQPKKTSLSPAEFIVISTLPLLIVPLFGCSTENKVRDDAAPMARVGRLTVEQPAPGVARAHAHLEGARITQIDVDADGDGNVDRWEYYASGTHRLARVGVSRRGMGRPDTWIIPGADGTSVARIEIAGGEDGRITRTEYHDRGELARAEEDTDFDGRIDKWEEYQSGALHRVGFDTQKTGRPTVFVDFTTP